MIEMLEKKGEEIGERVRAYGGGLIEGYEEIFWWVIIKGGVLMVVLVVVFVLREWRWMGRYRERLEKKGLIGGNWVIRFD